MPASPPTEPDAPPEIPVAAFDALLHWYRREARDLPWRRTDDPYRILVSEVMLQQTRVETVRERYGRFLDRFPDLEALAAADREEVLAEWSGLGYYRRARFLHRLARRVVEERDGELPRDADALRKLPGIGDYTAAAVASIAWGRPHLAVDGNVARVMARLLALADDPRSSAGRRILRDATAEALERHPAGDLNQALMELGARVCLPRRPRCSACPVARHCAARAAGVETEIPTTRKSAARAVEEAAAVLERDGRYLLFRGQRPGVLEGMWEFPTLDSRVRDRLGDAAAGTADGDAAPDGIPDDEPSVVVEARDGELPLGPDRLATDLARHLRRLQVPVARLSHLGEIRHGITSRRILCHVYRATIDEARETLDPAAVAGSVDAPAAPRERGWFGPEEIAELPLAASGRKTLELLG